MYSCTKKDPRPPIPPGDVSTEIITTSCSPTGGIYLKNTKRTGDNQ